MAGVAGLEPVTSAVTGQRSNQLSYTPARGKLRLENVPQRVKLQMTKNPLKKSPGSLIFKKIKIRAADAKEVGVGNPAEETCCHPNAIMSPVCNDLSTGYY